MWWMAPIVFALLSDDVGVAQNRIVIPDDCNKHASPKRVFNLYKDYVPRIEPRDDAPAVAGPGLEFLGQYDEVATYGESSDLNQGSTQNAWSLIRRHSGLENKGGDGSNYLGWVPRSYLAIEGEALRDRITGVHLKAFLRPSLGNLEHDTEMSQVTGRAAPRDDAAAHHTVRFYNFLFVMAKTQDRYAEEWLFLSTSYEFFDSERPEDNGIREQQAIGWIPKRYVEEWLTREAVQWSTHPQRPMVPGRIWRFPEDALEMGPVPVGASSANKQPLLEERFLDGKPMEQHPAWPRFPILEWRDREKYQEAIDGKYKGWNLERVAVPGGFVDENGVPLASAEEIAKLQAALQDLRQQIDNLEIMFVIDDTESMAPWFGVAAAAVSQIVDTCSQLPHRPRLRIGLTFYNDVYPSDPSHRPVAVHPLVEGEEIGKLIRTLQQHMPARGGDPREMVFEGIRQALTKGGFSDMASKLLIVIGDDGDKSDENDERHQEERRIADLLVSNPVPVTFAAIQVYPAERLKERPVAMAFRKQMETIAEIYHNLRGTKVGRLTLENETNRQLREVVRPSVFSSGDRQKVVDLIKMHFVALTEEQNKLRQSIDQLRRGEFGTALQWEVVRNILINDYGHSKEVLDKLSTQKGYQLVLDGFVWVPKDPTIPACTEYVLLLNRREMEDSRDALLKFKETLGESPSAENLRTFWSTAIGERLKTEWDLVFKPKSLRAAGHLLKRALDGLDIDLVTELRLRYLKMSDILNGYECDYQRRDWMWVRKDCREAQRGFSSLGGETTYYWVRVRDEYP